MKVFFYPLIAILITLSACGQKSKHIIKPEAIKLYDSAFKLSLHQQDIPAIKLLDSAIFIDSTYILAYRTKIGLLGRLNEFDKALETSKKLVRLRPEDPQCFVTTGVIYLMMKDTSSAQKYFVEADIHYDKILDTLSKTSKYYNDLMENKAENLVIMGQKQKGINILNQLYDKTKDEIYKDLIDSAEISHRTFF